MSHQGRLVDSAGTPVDGNHTVTITLWTEDISGSAVFTEDISADFDNGYYSLEIGLQNDLPPAITDNDELFVGIALDGGAELSGRHPLTAAPYALHALTASSVTGAVDATSVSVNGTEVIGSDGTIAWESISGVPTGGDTLADLAGDCSDGDAVAWDGTDWSCAPAGDHTHHADDITEGKLDVQRLPVGTDADTVAAGDHKHGAGDITSGVLNIAQLPVGEGSGKVLPGDWSVKVGANTANCDNSNAGALRLASGALEVCTGGSWSGVITNVGAAGGDGTSPTRASASCKDIKASNSSASDGVYWITSDPSDPFLAKQTWCEMDFESGGWTTVLSCQEADNCKVDTRVLYAVPWTDFDWAEFSPAASYLLGATASAAYADATEFMVEVTRTNGNVGRIIYPLNNDTRPFFELDGLHKSGLLETVIVNFDGTKTTTSLKICSSSAGSFAVRSYQGKGGLSFLNDNTVTPNASASDNCDFGDWRSQMLIRDPDANSNLTTRWGVNNSSNWDQTNTSHRIYVR